MKARMIFVLLLGLMLVLGACGGDENAETGPVEEAATAVTEAEATDTPAAAEATATPEAEPTTVTATDTMTETDDITSGEAVTGTDGTLAGTPTTEATPTDTDLLTGTAVLTGSEDITDIDGLTETGDIIDTTAADTSSVRGVVRASELLGYGVQNFEGEDLGSINDAMVTLESGCVDYMVLSFGGLLGLGDSLFLVPWRAITVDPQNERLVFNVQPEVLNEAPVFDVENLPDLTAEDWDADVMAYWDTVDVMAPGMTGTMTNTTATTGATSTDVMTDTTAMTGTMGAEGMADMTPCAEVMPVDIGGTIGTAASEAVTGTTGTDAGIAVETPRIMRLSELLGFNVTNPAGEDLGAIEDIMIDWRQDRIVYPILSFGGFLGVGEKWFVIPLDQISLDPIEQRLVFDVEPEQLENAPGYDAATLPDTTDPTWDEEIRSYWLEN